MDTVVERPLRLLVVEDEMLIRMVVSEVLRDAGYDVVEAANGDEALELLRAGVAIDLVLSDVRMPGSTDGLALLAFVRKYHAEVPVIISSGHLESQVALDAGASQFLGKPFRVEQALAMVESEMKKIS
ncbi:response regulator [Sphingomonas radiodurans]|nr:response regulator [Sphingomonas radiodurans]WBH17453.1 response regulator [Sphingomonas radiodurans]